MRGGFIVVLFAVAGCVTLPNAKTTALSEKVKLNFTNCGDDLRYQAIHLSIPEDYTIESLRTEYQFCEYRISLANGSILYVTSDIYNGSSLNFDNRHAIGVDSYSNARSKKDTISVGGKQEDQKHWKENIYGDYVFGYINCTDTTQLNKIIYSAKQLPAQ
ncbi:hypothetical protein SAMN05421640_1090 [Ekhidna lutea]|uniref:Lipoprotein n=1 Tax=Ekhidna lutea TaxID=447679 RepID=A0A239H0B3_EKHLU|nr:hypothetical protein [Ekhidna lutea]SNS74869.1 hypothetical protein SAMN05421640_1090 [Ekhidna lutea]